MNEKRLERLREALKERNLDAMLVRSPANLRYISGYSGSNGLACVTLEKAWFFTDFRYKTQAAREVGHMQVVVPEKNDLFAAMQDCGCIKPDARVGFEGNRLTFAEYNKLTERFPGAVYSDVSMLMEKLASVKEAEELDCLREAARISDAAFHELLSEIKADVTERQLDAKLSFIMKSLGSEKDSFDTIVASGVNGAKPHHKTSEKKLREHEFVTIDFGAMYRGYHADVTRTVCVGKASDKQREVYQVVLQAQLLALQELRAGMTGKAVDAVARDHISSKGYGAYFGHGLGHGLGLEVHAEPRLSPKYEETLVPDQVVTVEPGIYIPGWGGVRIEDDAFITEEGCVNITTANKELIEL
ncbi:MAG: Xaa-Pro peptidase family protein [Candidatus Marinimicrobia bacterium]|nr:Xaa-Pro peptidase family protein [Candidatus Neomarinimicrobiota bacterium]